MNDPEGAHGPREDEGQSAAPAGGLAAIFEDLEQQAAGIHLAERDAELADRARGEYATVSFASRVHASLGREVVLTLSGGDVVGGRLTEAGVDWCVLSATAAQVLWLVPLGAVVAASGMSDRAVPEAARPAFARLGFGSALHRLAGEGRSVHVHQVSGGSLPVRVLRIGADFVEVQPVAVTQAGSPVLLVPFAGIRAVRAE